MSFTNFDFLLFFGVVFILYWVIRKQGWQNLLLLAASYYFYGYIKIWYVILLGLSTIVDYLLSRAMISMPGRRRVWLGVTIGVNIGILGFFKYYNFFGEDLVAALNGIGWSVDPYYVSLLLPAGLSFFTLKKMGYMIDVSRGLVKPARSFVNFALYVSFFPQLISGPIDRPQDLLKQIEMPRTWKNDHFFEAWPLVVKGLFKKIVVANSLQVLVGRVFSTSEPSGLLLLSGSLGFTLQILADFSAYTDMSRGFARFLGFATPINFNRPYLSLTPSDFWNRWHITLSTWLRDYIFFPIQRTMLRNRLNHGRSTGISIFPAIATMLVSGVWHGAQLNFIIWGLYWGLLIVLYQSIGIRSDWKPNSRLKTFLAWTVMFSWIVISWAIFRAPSMEWLGDAAKILLVPSSYEEVVFSMVILSTTIIYALPLIIQHLLDSYMPDSWLQALFLALSLVLVIIYSNSTFADFIYFQF